MVRSMGTRAFTLVEILIVVVILGILAAITVPQIAGAANEAAAKATYTDLQKLRRAVEVFRVRNQGALPAIQPGDGVSILDPSEGLTCWGELVGDAGDYLLGSPVNSWVGGSNSRVVQVVPDFVPDDPTAALRLDRGWIYDPANGEVWAGGFDINDQPIPR